MELSRRHILLLSGVGLAAFGGGFYAGSIQHHAPDLRDTLLAVLDDPASAAAAGRAWFQSSGVSELDGDALALGLARRLKLQGWNSKGEVTLKEALGKSIRHDFETDDMVSIAGWQFARTSAELCALAASAPAPEA
ncbi:MAG: hypothetical protein PW790_04560 [Parvibaculaceae bacterium]|nr:hypothetical protein [Parvibaculaceae bacterium]